MNSEARKSKSDFVRTWAPILVGVAGLLFGATTFFLQYFYLPEHQARSLEVTSHLEKVGENESFVVIKGTIRVKNITKTRVEMLGGYCNVSGSRIEPQEEDVGAFSKLVSKQLSEKKSDRFALPLHYGQTERATVFASRLFDDTAWFDPEQEYAHEFHVYVPRDRYDLIQVQAVLAYAKDTKLAGAQWGVDEDGAIFLAACKKLPGYEKDASKCEKLDPDSPLYEEFARKYGLAQNDSVSELNLLPASGGKSRALKK